jgi:hypothetical protein
VRALGHPVVAATLTGGLVLGFLFLTQAGPGGIVAALILLIPGAWIMRAAEAVKRQRQFERAWDSMLPDRPAAPSQPMRWVTIVAMTLLVALVIWEGAGL